MTALSSSNVPVSSLSTPAETGSCDRPVHSLETYSDNFMLLKYRADLCYSTKDYGSAAALFERVLELLPPLNAMVKREVTDSLARCYARLGEHQRAREKAEKLVRL